MGMCIILAVTWAIRNYVKYVSLNNHMLDKLVEWGAKLPKRADGSYAAFQRPMTAMIGVDLDITIGSGERQKNGCQILG